MRGQGQAPTIKKFEQMNSQIPFDVIEDIMLDLPLKSLIRFKIVSKQWRNYIITAPGFAKTHLLKHQNTNSFIYEVMFNFNDSDSSSRLLLRVEEVEKAVGGSINFPIPNFPIPIGLPRIRNSCDGILCYTLDGIAFIHLWNPFTNWYKMVQLSRFTSHCTNVIGFGYDSSAEDYKLLNIRKREKVVQVMTLKSNSWRTVCHVIPCAAYRSYPSPDTVVHVNGNLYWLVPGPTIISFNLTKETFNTVRVPPLGNYWYNCYHYRLATFEGMLYFIRANSRRRLNPPERRFDVWVMKGKMSWVKLASQDTRIKGFINKVTTTTWTWPNSVRQISDHFGSLVSP